jgi:hypothetical protein
MATLTRGKKRLVVDVDVEVDSEAEVAAAFSRLSVSIVAKPTGDGSGKEHSTGKDVTCAATSGTWYTQQTHQQHPQSYNSQMQFTPQQQTHSVFKQWLAPRSVSVRFPFHLF